MGLPSGLLWATRYIDASQDNGFAESEYQYKCSYFSYGNVDPHNPTSESSFEPYSFGSSISSDPYVSSPGADINYPGSIPVNLDAARAICGSNWRIPSLREYSELLNNIDFIDAEGNIISDSLANKLTTINGIIGIRMRSRVNGNVLFFPCSGYGDGNRLKSVSSGGRSWASNLMSQDKGRRLFFDSASVGTDNGGLRYYGHPIRPVFQRNRR